MRRYLKTMANAISLIVVGTGLYSSGGWANSADILQSGVGNSLIVDQAADNSLLAGSSFVPRGENIDLVTQSSWFSLSGPATQTGVSNSASINFSAPGSVLLFQEGTLNVSSLSLSGLDATAISQQYGESNSSYLSVSDFSNFGVVSQFGSGNNAVLTVSGVAATGILVQNGDGNSLSIDVTGNGADVRWVQMGSASTYLSPASVRMNMGGSVNVVQWR